MPENRKSDAHQKALSLNLDGTIFGSFAEIGAGQEVARWFLLVGAASGTVAKTISAYDKEVSVQLYGAGTRYVSRPRLQAMAESEWSNCWRSYTHPRSQHQLFRVCRHDLCQDYAGTNDCHGCGEIAFIQQPGDAPNDVSLHVNLGVLLQLVHHL